EEASSRAAAGGPIDFRLSVDAAGNVTLTDLRSVRQGAGEAGDINEGTSLNAGLVSLTATVTDINNASASASVDVGPHLTFLDDGPTASTLADVVTDKLVLDESAVGTDTAGGIAPVGLASVTANF